MGAQTPTELLAPVQPITLWEDAQPIGTCDLGSNAKIVVRANQPDRQEALQRLIQIEYRVQTKHAKRAGIPFDASLFLFDLPRALGSCPISATRPSQVRDLRLPKHLTLPPFDLTKIPTTPRRKRTPSH